MRYPVGQPIRFSTIVKDVSGSLVTPSSIVLTIQKPDATLQNYSTPGIDGTGLYHQDVPTSDLTLVGHYQYKWVTTGSGAGVQFGAFDVFDPFDVLLISLQDAKDHLNIPSTDTTQDTEIQGMIDAIRENIESATHGPIVTRSVTERVEADNYGTVLMVSKRPLVSVVSITDTQTGTLISSGDVELDTQAGIIRRRLSLPFLGLSNIYTVVYLSGWGSVVPASINLAGKIILTHLWETQRGPTAQPSLGGMETTMIPGMGFAIPNRAAELLKPFAEEVHI